MPKLKDPRICKIFFSSPFGGMESEREELTRQYFPQIHHLCNSHGLQFAAVDMRWGISAESSDNAQVINICLRELDRSDMFIGFFGQRYGWHGADDMVLQQNFDNAVSRYPWLDQYRDKSVTELEFLHGHLNNPGQIPSAIYFRDKEYDDKIREEAVKSGDKKQIFKYSAESELSVKLMDDLKQRVLGTQDKALGVSMSYQTPEEAAKQMFDVIWKYLTETLLVDLQVKTRSRRQQINLQHEAFLASRCSIYVKNEEHFHFLNKHLQNDTPQPVVVTGPPGSGKSTLLCNWVTQLSQQSKDFIIVSHFIGYAEKSTETTQLLERLVAEFEKVFKRLQDGQDDEEEGEEKEEEKKKEYVSSNMFDDGYVPEVMSKLVTVMQGLISIGKTPVLVIDGLDKIKSTNKIEKALFWLPHNLPKSSLVLVSTLLSDTASLEALQTNRHFVNLELGPMEAEAQKELCQRILQESSKELSPSQLERIVEAEPTCNPLFLRLTLAELVAFGYFRLLDKKIDSLISSQSIAELFQKLLQRLEEDYNVEDYEGNLVEKVMCSICLSHQGLTEAELKDIFNIPDHVWAPLYFATEKIVLVQSGLIKLGFTELEEAILKRYLDDDKKNHYLKVLIKYFNAELDKLYDPYMVNISGLRPVAELPWLWSCLEDKDGLAKCLSHRLVFSELEDSSLYDLVTLWQETGLSASVMTDMLLSAFDIAVVDLYNKYQQNYVSNFEALGLSLESFLRRIDRVLEESGFYDERIKVLERLIQVLEEGLAGKVVKDRQRSESELWHAKYSMACVYCQHWQAERGIKLHEEVLKHNESLYQYTGNKEKLTESQRTFLGFSYHGTGVGYMKIGEYEKAVEYFQTSLEFHKLNPSYVKYQGTSMNNIGICYLERGEYEKALHHVDEGIKAVEEYSFGQQPPLVGELLLNKGLCYRRMGKLDEAEKLYQKALEVKKKALGSEHQIVAMSYLNLATLEMYRENFEKAIEYCDQTTNIYKHLGSIWSTPHYVMALENKACALCSLNKYKETDEFFMPIVDHHVKNGTMDRCIGSICREMAKFYIREKRFEDAYKVTAALLGSKHKTVTESYIHLALILSELGKEREEELNVPDEFRLSSAVERFPSDTNLVRYWCQTYLIPNNQTEEFVRITSRLHDLTEYGESAFTAPSDWCVIDGQAVEDCLFRINEEGLKHYPESHTIQLNLAKSYLRQDKGQLAIPLLVSLADQLPDNFGLCVLAVKTMALNGGDLNKVKAILDKMEVTFTGDEEQVQIRNFREILVQVEAGYADNTENQMTDEEKQDSPQ